MDRYDGPRERLLAVFGGQGEVFAQPGYRGCAFARASAESHPGDQAEQAGVPEPEVLARLGGRPARRGAGPCDEVMAATAGTCPCMWH